MKILWLAWFVPWITQATALVTLPTIVTLRRSASPLAASAEGRVPPSPDELRARAAVIREELKELEANASKMRRPKADLIAPKPVVPLPLTLLDSCWKVILEIRGVKSDKNRIPVRLTFCCKFTSDDNILQVEEDHRFVKRGFVWEPDRNPKEKKDFITFIAQVEGLSAVPDGRIYMNAFIDTIKGEDGLNRYQFSEGVVTIKEVINKSFWGIFNTAGLLAEFKVVGTWEAFPIEELPKKLSSE